MRNKDSLLTQNDIKNFILSEIQKITVGNGLYSLRSLSTTLGISLNILKKHKVNLPYERVTKNRRYYDIKRVTKYFLDRGFEIDFKGN